MFLKLLTIRCRLVYFSLIDQNETFLYTNFSLTRVFKRVTRVYTRPIRTRVKRIYLCATKTSHERRFSFRFAKFASIWQDDYQKGCFSRGFSPVELEQRLSLEQASRL